MQYSDGSSLGLGPGSAQAQHLKDIFDYTYVKSDHDKPKNSTYSMKNNWNLLFELLYCLCMLTEELQGLK